MSYLGIRDLHTNPAIFVYELCILRHLLCKSTIAYKDIIKRRNFEVIY